MSRVARLRLPGGRTGLPRLPPHAPGMTIGLFGGTFNPPHEGHRRASLLALRRLGLDQVWWLVTPGNPLKNNDALPPLPQRMEAARRAAAHPDISVSDAEAAIGVRFTYDAIAYLAARCRGVSFVWIMGADNLESFHGWQRWREIADLVPIAVVDRPGATFSPSSRAAHALARYRVPERQARSLSRMKPPAWCFLHGPRSALSSTILRKEALHPGQNAPT
ncbi:nicotinate-nucleotide adenylyltransferase [Hansschlegelia beijingensis]|uniref:Probable nicotinate-nucleotide adenylyltransferase n=2 Tax=Hansschlegelia beijingensis TaxID=1133344 RepID=A0A7W6D028_9HYPH|nr:nicotinate-nucleotide adenylyltransferase [Hansschlegelia beijingensis]